MAASSSQPRGPARYRAQKVARMDMHELFGEVISRYTRAQAIADGVLVDLSVFTFRSQTIPAHCGFKYPVAITCAAFHEIGGERCTAPDAKNMDVYLVLSALLTPLLYAIRESPGADDRVDFTCNPAGPGRKPLALYALCGPGDDLEPVITIMLPNED